VWSQVCYLLFLNAFGLANTFLIVPVVSAFGNSKRAIKSDTNEWHKASEDYVKFQQTYAISEWREANKNRK